MDDQAGLFQSAHGALPEVAPDHQLFLAGPGLRGLFARCSGHGHRYRFVAWSYHLLDQCGSPELSKGHRGWKHARIARGISSPVKWIFIIGYAFVAILMLAIVVVAATQGV